MTDLNTSTPTISIVIPIFNAKDWIEETLRSVEAQCFKDYEVIAVDDGSSDSSAQIVTEKFPWVRLIQTENRGCSAARKLGLESTIADYILYLDADDVLISNTLTLLYNAAQNIGADVVYGNWQRLNQVEKTWKAGEKVERKWQDVSSDIQVSFFTGMWCPTSAYLWRNEFLKKDHPGWHLNLPIIQDARYALDAAIADGKFVHIDATIVLYREHQADSVSTKSEVDFAKDCFLNCKEIWKGWQHQKNSNFEERKKAVLSCLENFGYSIHPLDKKLSHKMFREAKSIQSNWIPNATKKRFWTASLLGVNSSAFILTTWNSFRLSNFRKV